MGPTFLRIAKGLLRVAEKFVWVWNQILERFQVESYWWPRGS